MSSWIWQPIAIATLAAVTGTATSGIGPLQSAATGTTAVTGTASSTVGPAASSGTGTQAISGTAASTLGALASAATGSLAIDGSAASTLGALASAASGTQQIDGSAASTLGALASDAAGLVPAVGSGASTIGPLSSAASGNVEIVGTGASTVGPLVSTGSETRQGQFIDHFPGSTLDASWTGVATGDAVISVTDSTALLKVTTATGGDDAAALVRALDPSLGNYHRVAVCIRTNTFARRPSLWLMHDAAGTPTADTTANLQAKTLIRARTGQSTNWFGSLSYWNTGGTEQKWDDTTKTWTTGAVFSTPQISQDDYHVLGFDLDLAADQVRLFWIHRATGSSFAEEAHGPKLFALTDWVPLSSIRDGSSSTLYVVAGHPDNAAWASGEEQAIEWYAHEWGDALNSMWTDELAVGASGYTLKHHQEIDCNPTGMALLILPESRTVLPFSRGGSGAWDERDHKWGAVVYDPVTAKYWMAYTGQATNGNSGMGIASSLTGLDGSWTQFASNPAIPHEASQHYSSKFMPVLIKDETDPDSNRRWKCLVTCLSALDGLNRIFLYTAAQPDTLSWTREGIIIDEHPSDGDLGVQCYGAWAYDNGYWHVFYMGISAAPTDWLCYRAYGTTLAAGSLTKDRSIDYTPGSDGIEMAITGASSTSRIVDVDDTTGAVQDMVVLYDQNSTTSQWRLGRIRRVISSTQLELYHFMPGISTSGVLRSTNDGKPLPTSVRKRGNDWEWWGTDFAVMYGHATFAAYMEMSTRWFRTGSLIGAKPVKQWFHTPGPWHGRANNSGSAENPRLVSQPVVGVYSTGAASTLGGLASAGTGTQAIAGTGSATLGPLASTGTGAVGSAVTGTGASTAGPLASAGTGDATLPSVTGSGTSALGELASAAQGTLEIVGTATSTLGALASAATGSVTWPTITGLGASTVGGLASIATGLHGAPGFIPPLDVTGRLYALLQVRGTLGARLTVRGSLRRSG